MVLALNVLGGTYMARNIVCKDAHQIDDAFWDAIRTDEEINIIFPPNLYDYVEELFQEAEEKELETDHIDWEVNK